MDANMCDCPHRVCLPCRWPGGSAREYAFDANVGAASAKIPQAGDRAMQPGRSTDRYIHHHRALRPGRSTAEGFRV